MKEALSMAAFCSYLIRSRAALALLGVATVSMIMVASQQLHLFPRFYQNALLWHLVVPLSLMMVLFGRSTAFEVFTWRGWWHWLLPCGLYLTVALPF